MTNEDKEARISVEQAEHPKGGQPSQPSPGPHAQARLTDKDKTPDAGTLPEPGEKDVEPGSG